jgi:hypothetical protein
LRDLGRRRVIIDRGRRRDHKTKAGQAFLAAGRGVTTRTAPAKIIACVILMAHHCCPPMPPWPAKCRYLYFNYTRCHLVVVMLIDCGGEGGSKIFLSIGYLWTGRGPEITNGGGAAAGLGGARFRGGGA